LKTSVPVINLNTPDRVAAALRRGEAFYLKDNDANMLVYDPELEAGKKHLAAVLDEAKASNVYHTADEFKAFLDQL
ncbi:MAG: hypothetical protein LBL66_07845, partial [Clostridiales bacterium]|jgi:uncharacterized phage-like protein YoqJ|nr:hypothetical protein [Clostridiales bacterium]